MGDKREGPAPLSNYLELRDRVVLIVGDANRIGLKLVEAFARQGARVVFIDNDDDKFTAGRSSSSSSTATHASISLRCDLTDSTAMQRCLMEIIDRFGGIDVVIKVASGGSGGTDQEFLERCVSENLKQEFFVTQCVVPGMKWQGQDVILNMISLERMAAANAMTAYTASRAEIASLTRKLAHELEPHSVAVDCVLPGAVESAQQRRHSYAEAYAAGVPASHATGFVLRPDQVEALARFLADDFDSVKQNSAGN